MVITVFGDCCYLSLCSVLFVAMVWHVWLCVVDVCLCIFGFCVLVLIVMCGYVRLIVGLCVVIVRT